MSYTSHDLLDAARRAIPEVSVEAVAARRTRGDEVVLLDVREKDEVRTGYIEGAVTIPRGLLEFQAAAHLPQTDMDVVVYCASGARSAGRPGAARHGLHACRVDGGRHHAVAGRYPVVRDRQLSAEQLERYSRHFLLRQLGEKGQGKLLDASVTGRGWGTRLPGGVVPGRGRGRHVGHRGCGRGGSLELAAPGAAHDRPRGHAQTASPPPWHSTRSIRMSRCACIPSVSRWTTSWRSSRTMTSSSTARTISPRATW